MDFNQWKKRYNNAVGGNYINTYRSYQIVDGNYQLGEEISRLDFEQYRQTTSKIYDMNSNITIRPCITNSTEGFFEYFSKVKDERPSEVEEACLEEFIKEYQIVDRTSLENLLEIVNADTMIYKLKALSQLHEIIRKMQ